MPQSVFTECGRVHTIYVFFIYLLHFVTMPLTNITLNMMSLLWKNSLQGMSIHDWICI